MYTSVDFTSQNRSAEGVSYTNLVSDLAETLKIDYYYYYSVVPIILNVRLFFYSDEELPTQGNH
jgi:hypothetical protein